MNNIYLSLVIPAYNEAIRLAKNLPLIYDYLQRQNISFEIIIVDDGSIDNTSDIARDYQNYKENIILIRNIDNKGKGYAVRKGILAARGKICAFMDADLSVPLEHIFEMINYINQGYSVIIASRNIPGSWVKIKQPLPRRLMGRFFRDLTNFLLTKDISDITCGAKVFTQEAAEKIFSTQRLDDWSFDAEILFLAKKYNFKIKEIPVTWKDRHHSKVRFPRDIIKSLLGLIKIKLFDYQGYYHGKE